jgi:hypothetical protein
MSVTFTARSPEYVISPHGFRYHPEIQDWNADLNVSNDNFYRIMGLLGYERDELQDESGSTCGSFADEKLADLLQRVVFALESIQAIPALDGGTPMHDEGGPGTGRCRWIDFGMSEGYYACRLQTLRDVALVALKHKGSVTYA